MLADWLIEMGYDARVVLGKYKFSGHAWVVFFKDGESYLIEVVNKSEELSFSIVRYSAAYWPDMMFNRDLFWINTGNKLFTSYDSPQWHKTSRFEVAEHVEDNGNSDRDH